MLLLINLLLGFVLGRCGTIGGNICEKEKDNIVLNKPEPFNYSNPEMLPNCCSHRMAVIKLLMF